MQIALDIAGKDPKAFTVEKVNLCTGGCPQLKIRDEEERMKGQKID